jgi:dimethylhistidine N-methyltransferase
MTTPPGPVKEKRPRFTLITLRQPQETFAAEVRQGLTATPKWLPCKLFYDASGLALFDDICRVPEYYLTRTETAILRQHAAAIIHQYPGPVALAELGSGSSIKTGLLIEPALKRQGHLHYYPIDILASALEDSGRRLLEDNTGLVVTGLVGEFRHGLDYLRGQPGGPRLIAFLGSTVGNFNEEEIDQFFSMLRCCLRTEDRFLLGVDLLKDPKVLLAAYDDSRGVTARFNLNLLARLNRDLGADFDVAAFHHRAVFNEERSRIEMHLVSVRKQLVHIGGLGLTVDFAAGETIHTENCYKHSVQAMTALLERHGLRVLRLDTDPARWFGLFLVA